MLVRLAILRRISVYLIALGVSHSFPLFDASPDTLLNRGSSWLDWLAFPLLRWDAFHFAHVAQNGPFSPAYEYEWAFFPGVPLAMRLGAAFLQIFLPKDQDNELALLLLGGSLVTAVFDIGSVIILYKLSLHVFQGSRSRAHLTVVLSLLSSSPAVLNLAPYSEPIFTFFSYAGLTFLLCISSNELILSIQACYALSNPDTFWRRYCSCSRRSLAGLGSSLPDSFYGRS